ncbi:hypothetical protein FB446DRAFT_823864 [Lentinula raphanica]|nr:hypothetical protein FB446DRAFT_823864 [Lentinula raphanica]
MRLIRSVFYALMCLSAIHAACGSPVPVTSDRAGSPAPPGSPVPPGGSLKLASSEQRAVSPGPASPERVGSPRLASSERVGSPGSASSERSESPLPASPDRAGSLLPPGGSHKLASSERAVSPGPASPERVGSPEPASSERAGSPLPTIPDRAGSPPPPGGSLKLASSERAGSPSPPGPISVPSVPQNNSPAPPGGSTVKSQTGPAFILELLDGPSDKAIRVPQLTSHDLTSLIVNCIKAVVKFYATRELDFSIHELNAYSNPDDIRSEFVPDIDPKTHHPVPVGFVGDEGRPRMSATYAFKFKPDNKPSTGSTVKEGFDGHGYLTLCFSEGHLHLEASSAFLFIVESSSKTLKSPGVESCKMNIGGLPTGSYHFVDTNPGDRSGKGIKIEETTEDDEAHHT